MKVWERTSRNEGLGKEMKRCFKGKTAEMKEKGRGSGMFNINGWCSEKYIILIEELLRRNFYGKFLKPV